MKCPTCQIPDHDQCPLEDENCECCKETAINQLLETG